MSNRFISILLVFTVILASGSAFARVTGLPDFTELVEEAGPAVVNIRVTQFGEEQGDQASGQQMPEDMPEFFRRFFDSPNMPSPDQQPRYGAGSGFIIESDGYIVTNHHVVDGADEIIVRMADRREFEAELVGTDELSDIALLKVDAKNLPKLELGHSDSLKPGQWVVAIGSPFNYDQSVTAGIVSAKGRTNVAQRYVPFIQTDVAINRGNSGGPLLNLDGEVVGINSWILSSSGGYIGLSFSIPVETAESTVTQLREHGKVSRGLLGVQIDPVDRDMAEALGLDKPVGALVRSVSPDSAADKAGIEDGDVILEFGGEKVEQYMELTPIVGAHPPGTEAEVVVSRDGKVRTFDVVLGALEADEDGNVVASNPDNGQGNALGLRVESIGEDRRRALGDPEGGVVITSVDDQAAARKGLRRGDVILSINNEEIGGIDDFEDIVADLDPDKAVLLRVMREGVSRYIAYTPTAED